jgi:hypothetical protein
MDELSTVAALLAASDGFAPEILRLNAIILLIATLAVAIPIAIRQVLALRKPRLRSAQ